MRGFLGRVGAFICIVWMVAISGYGVPSFRAVCAVAVGAALVIIAISWRRRRRTAMYGPDLRFAMSVLLSENKWGDLLEIVGLTVVAHLRRSRVTQAARVVVGGRRGQRRIVRYIPAILGIRETSYGLAVLVRGVPGQSKDTWQRRCGQLGSALRVLEVTVTEPWGGTFELHLRVRDPLRESIVLPAPFVGSGFDLPLGVDEDGRAIVGDCRNVSGVVVGGVPGGGKSAWLAFALTSMAHREDVQWLLIDGKQGYDLEVLAPRAYRYISGEEAGDLAGVRDSLKDVQTVMCERLRNALHLYGQPNLWSARPSRNHPVVFVVIDECQAYLDSRSFTSKEEKIVGGEIDSCVRDLVKRGRSAGVVVVLSTQRPTADSIPTSTRDNCGLRICFSVRTREAAAAVLGEYSADSGISPIGAPTGVGVTSIAGQMVRFRSPYVPQDAIRRYVSAMTEFALNPLDVLCVARRDLSDGRSVG